MTIDGLTRSEADEAALDGVFEAAFAGGAGAQALAHLRALTIDRALGPNASDAELRFMEGGRWLVRLCEERRRAGAERKRRQLDRAAGGEPPDRGGARVGAF